MTNSHDLKLEKGSRVELVRTTDPYTHMTPPERGTVARISPDRIDIDWDCGSRLAMIPSCGDVIKRL